MRARLTWLILVGACATPSGCGRSSLLPVDCMLGIAPYTIDFGPTRPGEPITRTITLTNDGGFYCRIGDIGLGNDGDGTFTTSAAPSLTIGPSASATIDVTFAPKSASLPLSRSGTLQLTSNDRLHATVQIPLDGTIISDCRVAVAPPALDFGLVALGLQLTRGVTVTDVGPGPCELSAVAIGPMSDSEFTLAAGQPTAVSIAPGASATLGVTFSAGDFKPPHHRTGTLDFASTDPMQPMLSVPLSADIDVGCDLTITPDPLDFGNVILNTTVTASVTLSNDGTADCHVSKVRLGPNTDPLFSLAGGQPTSFTVPVNGARAIPVTFSASDSQPPHLRTGDLLFSTGNTRMPDADVPLSAYINTVCVEASRWIYTVDDRGRFSRFDPQTLTFFDIGTLSCPSSSTPNSMAVDQNAVAWVQYFDGNLFRVDTGTAACQATSFVPSQDGLTEFGMGFVFSPLTGQDTLYVAGGASTATTQSTLATISFPSLTLSPIGPVMGFPELSGLGDGTLWGFIPSFVSPTGMTELVRIDPATGNTLETHTYAALGAGPQSWAMKFWGGSFWLFLGDSIYQVQRSNLDVVTLAVASTGRNIVGAGVSTCAPLQ